MHPEALQYAHHAESLAMRNKTLSRRIYKGYEIRQLMHGYAVGGNSFATMQDAIRYIDRKEAFMEFRGRFFYGCSEYANCLFYRPLHIHGESARDFIAEKQLSLRVTQLPSAMWKVDFVREETSDMAGNVN